MRVVAILLVLAGCYHPSYRDCEVGCTTTCPDGLTCDGHMCRVAGAVGECASLPPTDGGSDAGSGSGSGSATGTMLALAAADRTCAACSDGSLWCWGENDIGQTTGSPQTTCTGSSPDCSPMPVSITLADTSGILGLSGGNSTTYAIAMKTDAAHLFAWGDNSSTQWGQSAPLASIDPVNIGYTGLTDVAAGDSHSCELQAARVSCAGGNASGQLGDGNTMPHNGPYSFGAATGTALAGHGDHTCLLFTANGQTMPQLECWGDNSHGQITGTATASPISSPAPISSFIGVSSFTAGANHTCLVLGGVVHCWGQNTQGQCGSMNTAGDVGFTLVQGVSDVVEVSAGAAQTCARTSTGDVWCWGAASPAPAQPVPMQIQLPLPAIAITVGRFHSCAILDDHTLWCWGGNQWGQVTGDGSHDGQTHVPTHVPICD